MADDKTLRLLLVGEDKSASRALKGVGDQAEKTEGRLSKMGTIAGGILGAQFLKDAAGAVVDFGKNTITAASDLGESVNAVNVTFGDSAAGILELGENAAQAVGLSNAQFNGLAVQFSSFADTVAGEGGDVVGVMDDLTKRSADFASVMNIDVADAAATFQSGLAGETEPLKKYGIDLSAAAVETYALANGIGTAGEALTEQEKVQARYGLLMEETAKTSGDFANTQDGMANASRTLDAEFQDLQAELGEKLLPFMEKAVNVGRDMIAWISENSEVLMPLAAGIGVVVAAVGLWAAGQWVLNAALAANPIGLVVVAIAALVAGLIVAYQTSETFRDVVQTGLDALYSAWQWLWNNGIAPVIRFILNGFANIVEGIASMLRALGEIPGFGWAKDAADAMDGAAGKARAMAQETRDIPDRKSVVVTLDGQITDRARAVALAQSGGQLNTRLFARGGYAAPGWAIVGEEGPELVNFTRPGRVYTAAETAAVMSIGRRRDATNVDSYAGHRSASSTTSAPVNLSESSISRLASAILAGARVVADGTVSSAQRATALAGRPV